MVGVEARDKGAWRTHSGSKVAFRASETVEKMKCPVVHMSVLTSKILSVFVIPSSPQWL